jgi:hypothetical protein
MTSYKKFLLGLAGLFIIALGLYGASFLLVKRSDLTTDNTITLSGKIACLPHKNRSGPQTTECVLGLQTSNQKYYSLKKLPDPTIATNTAVTIHGTLTPARTDELYNIVGTISVITLHRQ